LYFSSGYVIVVPRSS